MAGGWWSQWGRDETHRVRGRQNANGKTQKALSAGGNHMDGSDSIASLLTPLCGVGGVVLHLCEA